MSWFPTSVRDDDTTRARAMPITAAGIDLLVVHADGAWYAIEDRCSHAGCAFSTDGEIDGVLVICDCHGSEFDVRTGAVVRPPAQHPIATFAVRAVDGALEVDV